MTDNNHIDKRNGRGEMSIARQIQDKAYSKGFFDENLFYDQCDNRQSRRVEDCGRVYIIFSDGSIVRLDCGRDYKILE